MEINHSRMEVRDGCCIKRSTRFKVFTIEAYEVVTHDFILLSLDYKLLGFTIMKVIHQYEILSEGEVDVELTEEMVIQ